MGGKRRWSRHPAGCRSRQDAGSTTKNYARLQYKIYLAPLMSVASDHAKNDIESPEWHQDILAKRKRKIENGKAEFISIKKLKASHKS